ncbi:MAG: hypothetical protein C5B49_07515 [Bdellovibrio sp.]|nr:MAG: hypothetical protein C5B49_07515 [Bdellovibrio sp.]
MKAIYPLLLPAFICSGTWASLEPVCKTISSPFKSSAPFSKIKLILDAVSREKAIQLAWGEMLKRDQNQSVALPVLQYLRATESKTAVKGYFKVMAEIMTGGYPLDAAMKIWPKRPPAKAIKFQLSALCEMYHLAVASSTEETWGEPKQ